MQRLNNMLKSKRSRSENGGLISAYRKHSSTAQAGSGSPALSLPSLNYSPVGSSPGLFQTASTPLTAISSAGTIQTITSPETVARLGEANHSYSTKIAIFQLQSNDCINLVDFPDCFLPGIRDAVQLNWYRGIMSQTDLGKTVVQLKLFGGPWGNDFDTSRGLICAVLSHLYSVGWILTACPKISLAIWDKDAYIVRRQPTPPPATWMMISFPRSDKIRVTGAGQDVLRGIATLWRDDGKLASQKLKDKEKNIVEFKLFGEPWSPEMGFMSFHWLLDMIRILERYGWTIYSGTDGSPAGGRFDYDTWLCMRPVGWAPGDPVYHK